VTVIGVAANGGPTRVVYATVVGLDVPALDEFEDRAITVRSLDCAFVILLIFRFLSEKTSSTSRPVELQKSLFNFQAPLNRSSASHQCP
jgi:hypothetical protein